MTLMDEYDAAIEAGEVCDNLLQRNVLLKLQQIIDDLSAHKTKWYHFGRRKAVNGLYLYGPVGGGKTYLVDLFYRCIPEQQKARFHFHQFMQQVDKQLRTLQGQKDPLMRIAAQLAKTTRLLCFDEFLVFDVADAMILSELLQAILEQGVILVATSNTQPDDLYLNGVQRDRFLPAIDLIKTHCEVMLLSEKYDFRRGRTPSKEAYFYPLNRSTEQKMVRVFEAISPTVEETTSLCIQNRRISCVKCGPKAVWFTFDALCNLPRSQLDYLEIADKYDVLMVSNIPILTKDDTVRAILLIHLIDVMYDRGIQLIVSAAVEVEQLYVEGPMRQEFQRTLSRLLEMQSEDYVLRHHRREIESL